MIIGQLETLAKDEGFEEIKIKAGDLFNEETCVWNPPIERPSEDPNWVWSEVVLKWYNRIEDRFQ